MLDHHQLSNFIWQTADLLRGPYRPPQYERVMLPMTVLRRFDCVWGATKPQVVAEYERRRDRLEKQIVRLFGEVTARRLAPRLRETVQGDRP